MTIMAIGALLCMIQMYFFEDIWEDLVYRYILTPPQSTFDAYGGEKITSLSDVIESQISQWHCQNGRFLLHCLSQIFTTFLGRGVFSVCTAIVIFVTEVLLWQVAMRRNSRYPLLWAVLVSILFIQGYLSRGDGRVLTVMAYSFNYVWPLPIVLIFMSVIKRVANGAETSRWEAAGCVLLAILTGSTQEMFICPLCGATFVLLVYKLVRKDKVSTLFVVMCVCLWIASALVVFAPGTIGRSDRLNLLEWLKSSIYLGILGITRQLPFLAAVAACICFTIKYGWRKMLNLCRFESVCLVFSTMMSIVIVTGFWSYSGAQLYSMIVFLICVPQIFTARVFENQKRILQLLSIIVVLLFFAYRINVIINDYNYYRHNHAIVEGYVDSPDGIVEYTPVTPGRVAGEYGFDMAKIWINKEIQTVYGSKEKMMLTLTAEEMAVMADIGRSDSLLMPGNAGFYRINDKYYVKPATGQDELKPLRITCNKPIYHPIERLRLLWRKLRYGDESGYTPYRVELKMSKDEWSAYTITRTRYGDFVVLQFYLPAESIDIDE